MIFYDKSSKDYDPYNSHVLKYSGFIRDAVANSSNLSEAQRKIQSILEEAYTGRRKIDDPLRDIARSELQSLDEKLRRMS
ncbi:MAG: hypothetical protein AABX72_01195 [Nanoarchaeota archaeon]